MQIPKSHINFQKCPQIYSVPICIKPNSYHVISGLLSHCLESPKQLVTGNFCNYTYQMVAIEMRFSADFSFSSQSWQKLNCQILLQFPHDIAFRIGF